MSANTPTGTGTPSAVPDRQDANANRGDSPERRTPNQTKRKKKDMKTVMTQEVVDRLLRANVNNRRCSVHRIEAIARSMKDGSFVAGNGQTIVVNRSWTWLLDGQHRLKAMVMAGYPDITMEVVEIPDALAQKAFNTIDTVCGPRDIGQMLELDGVDNGRCSVAVVRVLCKIAWSIQSLNIEQTMKVLTEYKRQLGMLDVESKLFGKKVRTAYMAGVLNAMLICPEREQEIACLWNFVKANNVPKAYSNVRSLLDRIAGGRASKEYYMFFIATKAMLNPEGKMLKVRGDEDLSSYRCKNTLFAQIAK